MGNFLLKLGQYILASVWSIFIKIFNSLALQRSDQLGIMQLVNVKVTYWYVCVNICENIKHWDLIYKQI